MNIRIVLKSGDKINVPLRQYISLSDFINAIDFNKPVILLGTVAIMINDIAYIEEVPEKKEVKL